MEPPAVDEDPYGNADPAPLSHTPPNRLRDALVERLDLNSGGLPTGTRWPIIRTTVAGVGKKTWTSTWEPTVGSITGRSQPPSGPN